MSGPEGWRWVFWMLTIMGGISTIVLFFTLPETYAPILLRKKAQNVREETGDPLVYAAIEKEDQRILQLLKITLSRPFQLLFGDIIVFLVCLYLCFVYGVQYLFFQVPCKYMSLN
jgi:MFS family permease